MTSAKATNEDRGQLWIRSLAVSGFRSYRKARIAADARPVALFGANGAGKTNLLEAISLLSPGRGLRRATAGEMARRPEGPGWKIRAEAVTPTRIAEIETWSEGGAGRTVRIDGKAAPQTALGGLVRVIWLVPAMDRIWTEGAEGRRRFIDRAALSLFPAHADVALAYEKAMRERNRLLRDEVRDAAWYDALEAQMAEAGARLHANRAATVTALLKAQGDTSGAFPAADLRLVHPDGAATETAEDLRRALAESRARDMQAGRTLVGPHRSDLEAVYAAKGAPAASCSTGEQKALLISLVLANARALTADFGAPPILLLDEVAAHLDAERRAALFDEICALGAQAWMTGTEAGLFSALGGRALMLEVREENGASAIFPEPV